MHSRQGIASGGIQPHGYFTHLLSLLLRPASFWSVLPKSLLPTVYSVEHPFCVTYTSEDTYYLGSEYATYAACYVP